MLGLLTQVTDSAPDAAWYAIGLLGLWQIAGPIVASLLFKQWASLQARLTGVTKAVVYVVLSTLTLQVPKWVGYALDANPETWTAAAFFDLLTSIGATLLYKLGSKPDAAASTDYSRVP